MRRTALIAVGIALTSSSPAFAQGKATCTRADPQSCASAVSPDGDYPFPFTLLDLALLGGGASVALAAGATLRRMSAGDPYDNGEPEPLPVSLEPVSPQPLPSPLTITAASGH
jgi:hypothetical protein